MSITSIDRRRFFGVAGKGALGAGLALAAEGPLFAWQRRGAAPLRIGMIGFGVRGTEIARTFAAGQGTEIVAVADLYAGRRARAAELLGGGVTTTADVRQLLETPGLQAVVIATPDHWHAPMALQALRAGKDVYCESPVIHTAAEADALQDAAKGRIVQVGGGLASSPMYATARDMVASGRLGRVTLVRATWDTVSALDAWQRPFPPDASPETVDFAAFLGAAPAREFDLHRFFRWPCYWDYGSGLAGARFVPLLTAVHWILGSQGPSRASLAGGTWRWKDGREVPDALTGTFDYDEGFTAILSATQNGGDGREIRLVGTEATAVLTDRAVTVLPSPQAEPYVPLAESWPKEYRDWFYMMHGMSQQGQVRRQFPAERVEETYELPHAQPDSLTAHLANFVECVRTRAEPKEPLQLGVQAARAVALATERYRAGQTAPGQQK